jgi:hypothetical protein
LLQWFHVRECRRKMAAIFFFLEAKCHSGIPTIFKDITKEIRVLALWLLILFLTVRWEEFNLLTCNYRPGEPYLGFLYGIAQSVQRHGTCWTAGVRFLAGARDFSLLHSVQTGSGAHPASCPMGTKVPFSGSRAAGAWNWPLFIV